GSADVAMGYIAKLYALEKEAGRLAYSAEQIVAMRQEKARPILDDFRKWLGQKSLQTPPKGLLGKAVAYALRQWDRLVGYLDDGIVALDNNMAENGIRPFVIGRKNFLFSGTPEGAEASALLYSVIETAKANGLEPHTYLRHIFEKLPAASTLEHYEGSAAMEYEGSWGGQGAGMWVNRRLPCISSGRGSAGKKTGLNKRACSSPSLLLNLVGMRRFELPTP
ncbi:MAG: transposase, partial [Desulfopila sp.]